MSFWTSYRIFSAFCLAAVLIWWNVLSSTLRLALRSDAYTHILLIVPLSAVLIALRLRDAGGDARPNLRAGAALIVLAALIGITGLRWEQGDTVSVGIRWTIEMLALVVWWMGSFVLCFGTRLARHCAFPLLFLLWLVPMPELVLQSLIAFLQHGTAWMTREMFAAVGVPVTGGGTIVTVPGLSIEVAEECSSIRSSMILIVMATLMACLMLRSYWGRLVVILVAVPLAVAKNALRVFTLQGIGAYVDPAVLNSPLHRQGGVLFLIIALAALFGVICLLRRLEGRNNKSGRTTNLSHLSMTAGS